MNRSSFSCQRQVVSLSNHLCLKIVQVLFHICKNYLTSQIKCCPNLYCSIILLSKPPATSQLFRSRHSNQVLLKLAAAVAVRLHCSSGLDSRRQTLEIFRSAFYSGLSLGFEFCSQPFCSRPFRSLPFCSRGGIPLFPTVQYKSYR